MPAKKRRYCGLTTFILLLNLILPASAPALSFNSAPARFWGHLYKSPQSNLIQQGKKVPTRALGERKSEWRINFISVPDEAKKAIQAAVDIWSANFSSKVPINIDVLWERGQNSSVLGSARPGFYFNSFPGAPDDDLWYPSALANALAANDLDPKQPEIVLKLNSMILWYFGVDGRPNRQTYDLSSVVLHEIGHGLGFLSNAEYDQYFGTGYMFQPTPYDAFVQLPDNRTFLDFCSRSADLGKAMIGELVWSGVEGIGANNGIKPKLYTPSPYLDGSSITHLDEDVFAKSSTDALMTPNLEPGESFSQIGPIAIGMIADMMKKPPVSAALEKPAKPVNVRALIGDRYALVTFDSPNCRRIDKVTGFNITTNPGGVSRSFTSSPAKITGLKNGQTYNFSITAENSKGLSDVVTTNSIKPEATNSSSTIDPLSRVNYLTTTTWRGLPTIVYADELSGQLKIATFRSSKWTIQKIREGVRIGNISLCKSGKGSSEFLHIIYADLENKDVVHGFQSGAKWKFEIVDGNGAQVQDYSELTRVRTAADLSVSNACAVTPAGLQVFYRDETQGILLGAVKTESGWVYEIVDGDRKNDGHTTGDVAFHLVATSVDKTVYLFYDSVLTVAASQNPLEGEVRLAARGSIYPEDWRYEMVDGPDAGSAVAGFALALYNNGKNISLSWLSASGESLPSADQVKLATIDNLQFPSTILTSNYGIPQGPLALDSKGVIFGCQGRLCKLTSSNSSTQLANSAVTNGSGAIVMINKIRHSVAPINGRLTLTKL